MLNGFYIDSTKSCKYCNDYEQETCSNKCTKESLTSANMKPLTSSAKNLISNATWYTYGVNAGDVGDVDAAKAYLQEMGISTKYTGNICTNTSFCADAVERTTSDIALIGLMSISDIRYANGWLYNDERNLKPWSITPVASYVYIFHGWHAESLKTETYAVSVSYGVWPTVYLNANVQMKSGTGTQSDPYLLKIE